MSEGGMLFGKPEDLHCETSEKYYDVFLRRERRRGCRRPASFIYGPECETTTGNLMYLCDEHAQGVKEWIAKHLNDPVQCKVHGEIGPVKEYLVLKEM